MEAIVLAGGQGSRLQSVLPDQQKCMASILGKPFLEYLIKQLASQGFNRFILAIGHHHAQVADWVNQQPNTHQFILSVEDRPLGTGGALLQALNLINSIQSNDPTQVEQFSIQNDFIAVPEHDNPKQDSNQNEVDLDIKIGTTDSILVINGDSLISFDYASLLSTHLKTNAALTLACTPVEEASRFGSIEVDDQSHVIQWKEKGTSGPALINAGIYLVSKSALAHLPIVSTSLEKEIIPSLIEQKKVAAVECSGPMLDIGTPESFSQAEAFIRAQFPSS